MKTKTIFDSGGIQVWETDNKDPRGKEWHIHSTELGGCSIGFRPELNVEWLKEFLRQCKQENKESLDSDQVDLLSTNE